MNNTPKTVAEILTRLENAVAYDVTKRVLNHQSGRSPKSSHLEAITALNELKSELTKQQVVSALQQTALDHIVGGDYEDLLTKNLNAELRAEERLQK